MKRELVLGEGLFVIHDFVAPEECDRFIAMSEERGYEAAPINTLSGLQVRGEVRNNSRIIWDDPALAAEWLERARDFLLARQGKWDLAGLNERFRFYRYDPGQTFKRHYDASFCRSSREQSFLTLMVYLNDDYTGGGTHFYHPNDQLKASITPKVGMALVFDHQQVHEGAVVETGRKYVLRTDVMYRRRD